MKTNIIRAAEPPVEVKMADMKFGVIYRLAVEPRRSSVYIRIVGQQYNDAGVVCFEPGFERPYLIGTTNNQTFIPVPTGEELILTQE